MTHYDTVVVGGGTGNKVASAAAAAGDETALVSEGPLGGTCVNTGCNPTKMLIKHADALGAVREADRFHVSASVEGVDYAGIVEEVSETVDAIADRMEAAKREEENLRLYRERAAFVDERTLDVGGERVTGDRVVLAAGSRPLVPPIDGLESVDYLTSDEAIRRTELPDELVILGGGYVAAELGYFFETMGADVTMVEMLDTLVPREDPEVAAAFTDLARERHEVLTGHRVTEVSPAGGGRVAVHTEGETGERTVEGDAVLVALGRRPNSDTLTLDWAGVETTEEGFVRTDERLRTTADGVWAQGDLADNWMFKHSADYETEVVIDNVVHDRGREVDYTGMAHAVFTDPEIGATGHTEADLREAGRAYVVGRAAVADTAMGRAMKVEDEREGFAKVLADPATGELLGCHVIGPEAATLVHEAVVAKRAGSGTVADVADAIHVHPSLAKLMKGAFRDAQSEVQG